MSLEFSAPPPAAALGGEESPGRKRASGLREVFKAALAQPAQNVSRVKGNLLIHIPGIATWTVVTQGPRTGLHDFAADDDVHFAMSCRDEVLLQLFAGSESLELGALIESGKLQLEGDVKVFGRFIELIEAVT